MKKNNYLDKDLPMPSEDEVEFYLKKWGALEDYKHQESALNRLFNETYCNNSKIDEVLIKVASLNDFYSTNIFSVYTVAKHVQSLKIDNDLKCHDKKLVNKIALVDLGGRGIKNFYSFATKYCSHHFPLNYPIYDSYIDRVFRYYRYHDKFASFKNDDLKNYPCFVEIFKKFQSHFKLEKYTLKQMDRYLWLLGKNHFN
ncbi:hypothetical protein [Salisediminibacterium beveridgei]|uniref:Uncharacterized protein n=1 Tax=Salisediminibacterium beveridgei TaxID=632773 RepID=A0A1D7QWY6_9BACI|nr:hypothetical protein [Salisediminibacterium beveridgei]AOM83520.1 hypothetical protein BBEV_2162 [Salisediminibacterium beveridgei]